MKAVSIGIAILFVFGFCNNKPRKSSCHYNLNQLLISDTPKVIITYQNDTLTEVRDRINEKSGGIYTFDKNKNLRYYAFMIDSLQYQYSEEYDIDGNVINRIGKPLVMHQLQKEKNDTVSFVISLFSLNKKYGGIQVVSNRGDTIEPGFLYKNKFYSNLKCFFLKLPVAKDINNLMLYTNVNLINTCSNLDESFSDTMSFKKIKL
jgi:hypothetical protein